MNLQDLMYKLQAIEEGKGEKFDALKHVNNPTKGEKDAAKDVKRGSYGDRAAMLKSAEADGRLKKDESIEVIGGPLGGMMGGMGHNEPPKQQDNVDMNITLHGAGPGGVRDLMNILHNIETGNTDAGHDDEHDHQEPIMGDMIDAMAHEEQVGEVIDADDGETWANSSHGDSGHHTHGIDSVITTGNDMNSKGGERAKVNGGGNPMQESLVTRLTSMYEEIKGAPIAEEKKTMSRAAKGNEKYGKDGMKALAKAGKEGASEKELDTIRDKHDNYNEAINESADILKLAKMLRG